MQYFNDYIGKGTRDLQACSAVPQQTAPTRTYSIVGGKRKGKVIPLPVRCGPEGR